MNSENIFKITNLSQVYEGKEVLSLPELSIKPGEKIALIGSSGAGKSTLLGILSGTIDTYRGEVYIHDLPINTCISKKKFHRKVGIIRQHFDLVGELSVINNVLAGRLGEWGFFKSLFSLFVPQEKKKAVSALTRVGLIHKTYRKTSTLSGGEQQRVALARILIQNPEVILADEPVASLDPQRAEDILKLLVKLVDEENETLIASLHSVEYAKKYFTRIIALKDGVIFFDLEPKEVTEEKLSSLYSFKGDEIIHER